MKTIHKSLRIVGIQQVEKYIIILLHIHGIATIYHIFKFLFFHRFVKEKVMDSAEQWVIHNGIILISLQPLTCIVPDFSQQINVWFYRFKCSRIRFKNRCDTSFPTSNRIPSISNFRIHSSQTLQKYSITSSLFVFSFGIVSANAKE